LPILIYRGTCADWHGTWTRPSWPSWASLKRGPRPTASPAPAVARRPEEPHTPEALPTKPPAVAETPKPNQAESKPESNDAWADIRREAERKKAELAEREKLKEKEA